jgi:hypothetical protein
MWLDEHIAIWQPNNFICISWLSYWCLLTLVPTIAGTLLCFTGQYKILPGDLIKKHLRSILASTCPIAECGWRKEYHRIVTHPCTHARPWPEAKWLARIQHQNSARIGFSSFNLPTSKHKRYASTYKEIMIISDQFIHRKLKLHTS